MATFNNVSIPRDQWVNITTLSGANQAQACQIQNISTLPLIVRESATQPAANERRGGRARMNRRTRRRSR